MGGTSGVLRVGGVQRCRLPRSLFTARNQVVVEQGRRADDDPSAPDADADAACRAVRPMRSISPKPNPIIRHAGGPVPLSRLVRRKAQARRRIRSPPGRISGDGINPRSIMASRSRCSISRIRRRFAMAVIIRAAPATMIRPIVIIEHESSLLTGALLRAFRGIRPGGSGICFSPAGESNCFRPDRRSMKQMPSGSDSNRAGG